MAAVFFALLAAPLPGAFFREWGWVAGPLAWLGCALLAARVLGLRARHGALAAAASGLVGGLVGSAAHNLGMVVGVLAFGVVVGAIAAHAGRRGATLARR